MTNYNPNCGYYEDYSSGYYSTTAAAPNAIYQQDYYMQQDYEYKHGYE